MFNLSATSEASVITVIGSSNMDMVISAPHIPAPGETIPGSDFEMLPGGKGANQAVTVARLSGKVNSLPISDQIPWENSSEKFTSVKR